MRIVNLVLIILGVLIIASLFYQNVFKVEEKRTINLYYYNPSLDEDETGNIMCSEKGIVEVKREVEKTMTPIQDSIKLLLKGELTEEEKALGITTEYPLEGFSLKGALLKDGDLTLEFDDLNDKTIGGSCRTAILWFQIRNIAMQFSEVKTVKFIPEELFQP